MRTLSKLNLKRLIKILLIVFILIICFFIYLYFIHIKDGPRTHFYSCNTGNKACRNYICLGEREFIFYDTGLQAYNGEYKCQGTLIIPGQTIFGTYEFGWPHEYTMGKHDECLGIITNKSKDERYCYGFYKFVLYDPMHVI